MNKDSLQDIFQKHIDDITSDIKAQQSGMKQECILAKVKINVMGGRFVKFDGFDIFFEIPVNSEANKDEFLREQRDVFKKYGITLKVKKI